MTPFGQGSIVNIASGADLVGVPGFAGYAAAKHGQVGLTKATALDYGPQGNAIAAGLVDTPLVATGRPPEVMTARIAAHPIGRIGRPEEIADVVACYPAGTLLALILHLSALGNDAPRARSRCRDACPGRPRRAGSPGRRRRASAPGRPTGPGAPLAYRR